MTKKIPKKNSIHFHKFLFYQPQNGRRKFAQKQIKILVVKEIDVFYLFSSNEAKK